MTWLVWVLVGLIFAGLFALPVLELLDWFGGNRLRRNRQTAPDPVAEHYAARRRERTSALTEWERDFRRAQGLPESATTTLGRGEAVVPVSRMLTTANRLMWPPTRAELNPARDVECVVDRIEDPDLCSAPHAAPSVPRPKPARAITVIQD